MKTTFGTPFKKGQSGNPGGRPKIANEVRELARVHTVAAINKLAKIMNSKKSTDRDALAAANSLLARGYGKPTQDVMFAKQSTLAQIFPYLRA